MGREWTIELGFKVKEKNVPGAEYKTALKAIHNIGHALEESDVLTPMTLLLKPLVTDGSTGKISLEFAPAAGLYDEVSVELYDSDEDASWKRATTTLVNTSGISSTDMPSGTYSVTINFKLSGALVYSTTQVINVFDNMTTDTWIDGGGSLSPINNGVFTVTPGLIRQFYGTNFYVSESGDDTNSGSYYDPLKTIGAALGRIAQVGTGSESYTIRLVTAKQENVSFSDDGNVGLQGKASSITIKPASNTNITVSGDGSGRVFSIETSVPVTLEKLTVTGGAENSGSGVYAGANAVVALKNCSVTENFAGNESGGGLYVASGAVVSVYGSTISGNNACFGGGVYNEGTLTLTNVNITGNIGFEGEGGVSNYGTLNVSGKVRITGNTMGDDTDSPQNNLYLPEGHILTVVGAFSADSTIGVSTQNLPVYGNSVVFSSGFAANNPGKTPSEIFTSDPGADNAGFAVISGAGSFEGEAALGESGGNIKDILSGSGKVTVEIKTAQTLLLSEQTLSVSAVFKDSNGENLDPQPSDDELSWKLVLLCGDKKVEGVEQSNTRTLTIPRTVIIPNDAVYTFYASVVYRGIVYDTNIMLTGDEYNFHSTITDSTNILFGDFPQTIKASNVTIDESKYFTMGGYTYYKGSDDCFYTKITAMPYGTNDYYKISTGGKLTSGTEYYFKLEPVKWVVKNSNYNSTGKALLFATTMLMENIPYYLNTEEREINGSTVYPNNYKYSTMRAYLNGSYEEDDTQPRTYSGIGFLQSAFTAEAQARIEITNVNNSAASTNYSSNPYACENTNDKIFLLSYNEAPKEGKGSTDFAIANHVYKSQWGNAHAGYWWMRSPVNSNGTNVFYINVSQKDRSSCDVTSKSNGIVPALVMELP